MPNRANSPTTRSATLLLLLMLLAVLMALVARMPQAASPPGLAQGPGGPILVITPAGSAAGDYYAEILRNEGLNAFAVADTSAIDTSVLAAYDTVILAKTMLTSAQVTILSTGSTAGGNLIAMAPDPQLAPLLGLTPAGHESRRGLPAGRYLHRPGNGICRPDDAVPRRADRYSLNGAAALAHALQRCGDGHPVSGAHAERLRGRAVPPRSPTTWRLRSSRRARATRPGPPRSATASPRSVPTTSSSATRSSDAQPDWVDLANRAADSAGRRAAAPARQPHPADEPEQEAAASLLVLPEWQEGGGDDARRRPRQRRHGRALRPVQGAQHRRAARSPTGSACAARPTSTPPRR